MQAYYLLCATVPYELGQLLRSACTVVQTKTFFLERNELARAHLCVQKSLMRGIKQRRLMGG